MMTGKATGTGQVPAEASFLSVRSFIDRYFRHFNSYTLKGAATAFRNHIRQGGKMMLAMGGAMSTAEIGRILAEMIRKGRIHAISCTGANLEEDIFNLVAHKSYRMIPNYYDLSPSDEKELLDKGLNRVTDTCIPEEEAMRKIERLLINVWKRAEANGERFFPYEYFYQIIREGHLDGLKEVDERDSWVVAACEKNIPIWSPGWEDSTTGNILVALSKGSKKNYYGEEIKDMGIVKSGLEQMSSLVEWYIRESSNAPIGLFQIGGGISGDFPICVVPLINQDMKKDVRKWSYFCQISDSTTSYGSYSGAVPNEKITWGKLDINTPRFMIESDATIVAPLVFAYVLA